jgi:transposase-like protein
LERKLGTQLSHETISNITDAVGEEVKVPTFRAVGADLSQLYLDAFGL